MRLHTTDGEDGSTPTEPQVATNTTVNRCVLIGFYLKKKKRSFLVMSRSRHGSVGSTMSSKGPTHFASDLEMLVCLRANNFPRRVHDNLD